MKHALHKEMFHLFYSLNYENTTNILSHCFMGLAAACQKQVPQSEVVRNAIAFCETFYDLDYAATKELVVPASLPYLSYMATNTTQELIDKVNAKGPVVVTVISEQMNPEEGHATVICSVKNYLKADFFNGTSAILPEKQDTIHLVKEDERWLVKMDNPLQSGMQNHD